VQPAPDPRNISIPDMGELDVQQFLSKLFENGGHLAFELYAYKEKLDALCQNLESANDFAYCRTLFDALNQADRQPLQPDLDRLQPEQYKYWNPYWEDVDGWEKYKYIAEELECDQDIHWCDAWFEPKLTAAMQNMIWKKQHPPDCTKAKLYLYRYQAPGQGVASVIHTLSAALGLALRNNFVMVPVGDFHYAERMKDCAEANLDCFFHSITNCTLYDVDPDEPKVEGTRELGFDFPQNVRVIENMRAAGGLRAGALPLQYHWKGKRWWRAQSLKYFFRPRPWLLNYLDEQKMKIFPDGKIPRPIVLIHVRFRGPKEPKAPISLHHHIKLMEESGMVELFKLTNIFLTVEDTSVIAETANFPGYNWFYTNQSVRDVGEYGRLNKGLLAWTNLFVASECDFFVGSTKSSWFDMIDEFRAVSGKAKSPRFVVD